MAKRSMGTMCFISFSLLLVALCFSYVLLVTWRSLLVTWRALLATWRVLLATWRAWLATFSVLVATWRAWLATFSALLATWRAWLATFSVLVATWRVFVATFIGLFAVCSAYVADSCAWEVTFCAMFAVGWEPFVDGMWGYFTSRPLLLMVSWKPVLFPKSVPWSRAKAPVSFHPFVLSLPMCDGA